MWLCPGGPAGETGPCPAGHLGCALALAKGGPPDWPVGPPTDEELYAGVYIDFMGTDAAIFRTLGKQTAMRTDQYNSRWLNGERIPPVLGAGRGGGVEPVWVGLGACLAL